MKRKMEVVIGLTNNKEHLMDYICQNYFLNENNAKLIIFK